MSGTSDVSFTSDLAIDNFVPGDDTIELTGFVDTIEGTRSVKDGTKKIYSIILNNGSKRRMRILFWERQAEEWSGKITDRMVLEFTNLYGKLINPTFYKKEFNIIKIELTIIPKTTIAIISTPEIPKLPVVLPKKTSIADFPDSEGLICMDAYVKVNFAKTTGYQSTFATGAVTDGTYRLRVQICNFVENPKIKVGSHVRIMGKKVLDKRNAVHCVDEEEKLFYLRVQSSQDIELLEGEMTKKCLDKGILTPLKIKKNNLSDENTDPSNQRDDDDNLTPTKLGKLSL